MSIKSISLAAAIAMSLSATTHAADLGDMFSVRGYSTLGAVYSDEDQADVVTQDLVQKEGVGHSDEISYELDSRAGLQIDATFNDKLSAVVQLISENANNNSWDGDRNKPFKPSLEWANITYRPTDNLTIRGGRIVLPFLMVSEYRKVGYASHWLRPPVEVYGQVPFTASDGMDVSYRMNLGDAVNTVRVHHGYNGLRTHYGATQVRASGINNTYEVGSLSLRAAYMSIMFEAAGRSMTEELLEPFQAIMGTLPPFMGADAAAAAARLEKFDPANPQRLKLYEVGMAYDPGNWLMMAELSHQSSAEYLGKTTAGFVSAGARINSLTPYATFAMAHKHDRDDVTPIPLAALPPPLAAFGDVINNVVLGLSTFKSSQRTISVGARWDAMPNVAIKTQFDHIRLDSGSYGLLSNHQPGFEPGGDLNLVSIAVDFVF